MDGRWINGPRGSKAVVYVHGVLSSGDTAWTHSNGTYWPTLLAKDTTLPPLGVYVYTDASNIFSGSYRLGDVVDDLKERLRLDGLLGMKHLVFVCHSMGALVVRKLLVERAADFVDRGIACDLFLIASPSLGSTLGTWLAPLARALGHRQAAALRFIDDNDWLADLDKEFQNLKASGRLALRGKELAEDKFLTLKGFLRRQVVEPFSANRYFGESLKISGSDHFSIAKPDGPTAIQHRLLVDFLSSKKASAPIAVSLPTTASAPELKEYTSLKAPPWDRNDLAACQAGANPK